MGREENIVGKGENAGYQHFPFFPTMFSKGFYRVTRIFSFSHNVFKRLLSGYQHFLLFSLCFQKASFWLPGFSPFLTMFSKGFFLVTSIFSFSHNVFQRLISQAHLIVKIKLKRLKSMKIISKMTICYGVVSQSIGYCQTDEIQNEAKRK